MFARAGSAKPTTARSAAPIGSATPFGVGPVAADHEGVAPDLGHETVRHLVGQRGHPDLAQEVGGRTLGQRAEGLPVAGRVEVRRAVDVEQEVRDPARRQLDDADAKPGEPLEDPVEDEVGQRHRRCHVQEDGIEELLAVLLLPCAPGRVQRALELRDVEDRCHTLVAERSPHRVEVGCGQRLPVDGSRCDHGEAEALGPDPLDLLDGPRRVVQEHVGHTEEAVLPVVAHVGHEAVVRPRVGTLRLAVRGQPLLPQEAVVGEHHGGVQPELVERVEPRPGQPVVVGHQLVERRRRSLTTQPALAVLADERRTLGDRDLERGQVSRLATSATAIPPSSSAIDSASARLARVDVLGPGRPRFEEMLVDVDGLQRRHGPSRRVT